MLVSVLGGIGLRGLGPPLLSLSLVLSSTEGTHTYPSFLGLFSGHSTLEGAGNGLFLKSSSTGRF